MSKKLLVVGSNSIHVFNFIELVKGYFDEVLLLTDKNHRLYSVKTIAIDYSLGLRSFSSIKKIKMIVHDFQPTTVHMHQANSYSLLTLLSLRKYRCQKILTAWGSDILINPKESMLLNWIVKYILNEVDIVTADSDIVLAEANKLVKKDIEPYNINFGIELDLCIVKKENIIYSNRLHKPLYNIDKIILSFSKFFKQNSNWKLVLAGNGEDTDRLKALVVELNLSDVVEFIGWVDAKTNYEYYCKSKIYVSIPKSDSISLSLVEGIICGCIPFVSELPANREIINSEIGFVVEDLNTIPFQKYKDIEPLLFEIKRKKIEHYFSKSFNREKYLKLYGKTDES
jgi:glycosyltransferase involved in cell wall biosynthesis